MTTFPQMSQAYNLEPANDLPTVYVLPKTLNDARLFYKAQLTTSQRHLVIRYPEIKKGQMQMTRLCFPV